jgi:hypothetical protein
MSSEELQEMMEKANKWDSLAKKIAKCYVNEDGSENDDENIDLATIGEIAAIAFGWL